MNLRDAYTKTVYSMMKKDKDIFLIGEGARIKASFDCPQILSEFPDRVLTAPISEAGIVNVALGAALNGMRPIIDLTFNDLALRAMDEIINQVGKLHYMSAGKLKPRVLIKADFNRPENAQSGNRLESFFLHQQGIRVAIPSNPIDMIFFTRYALTHDEPMILFEDRLIKNDMRVEPALFGKSRYVKRGKRATIISYGYALHLALEAVKDMDVSVIDLRTLNPLDLEFLTSVNMSTRAFIVEPSRRYGIGGEIASLIVENSYHNREVERITGKDYPFLP